MLKDVIQLVFIESERKQSFQSCSASVAEIEYNVYPVKALVSPKKVIKGIEHLNAQLVAHRNPFLSVCFIFVAQFYASTSCHPKN